LYLSWPGSSRPSTSYFLAMLKDVDTRDKRGHDDVDLACYGLHPVGS
jgi:hypothetical protein